MKAMEQYYEVLLQQMQQIRDTQWEKLEQAAGWLADTLVNDHFLYAFGTGHSHMLAEEIFYRAGNLARSCPILDDNLMLHKNAIQATYIEREEGYGSKLLASYPVEAGDLLIVASNSGRNSVPIDVALAGKDRGMRVISITNFQHSRQWGSRHASGKTLSEVADLALDNCGVSGDSALKVDGLPGKIGPTTTSTGALMVNCIIVQGIEIALQRGTTPEIFISSNSNGDDHNDILLQKYKSRVKHL
jgi:uncharacterized phosphosugar-binding protein